jgi:hypothetical protein
MTLGEFLYWAAERAVDGHLVAQEVEDRNDQARRAAESILKMAGDLADITARGRAKGFYQQ